MPTGQAVIIRSAKNNNFVWTWDDDVNTAGVAEHNTAAGIGAAIDAIKPLAQALPGTIQRVEITVVSQ